MEATEGTLLGGRVRYAQPAAGYRTGIEPVLLAAAVPALAGQTVLEAGTGAGAGLICLLTRVAGVSGIGVEIDPEMAAMARANAAANGLTAMSVLAGDVTRLTLPAVDHAMANPPWYDRTSTGSPSPQRRMAMQEGQAGVEAWVRALAGSVRSGGSMTLVVSAGLVQRILAVAAMVGFGGTTQLLLRPKAGRPPKIVLLQAWRDRMPGAPVRELTLHREDGGFTPEIETVLRHGAALENLLRPSGQRVTRRFYGGVKSFLLGP